MREWAKEKAALKQRTIKLIEDQVEETSTRLKKELELTMQQRKNNETHEKLATLKIEYEHKMKVINEIKREKELREQAEARLKEEVYKKRGQEVKVLSEEYR